MAFLDVVGGLGTIFKDIIGSFKLSPEAKLELDKALAENDYKLKRVEAELEAKIAESAGENIRAEAASASWMAKNSRPAFIFGMGLTIMGNLWIPMLASAFGRDIPIVAIPEEVYWLFGAGFLGYTGARSWEKMIKIKAPK